jgi:hypothetical protein
VQYPILDKKDLMEYNEYMKTLKDYTTEILIHSEDILSNFVSIAVDSIEHSSGELSFFRYYFPKLTKYINGSLNPLLSSSGIRINAKYEEIHAKPKVTYSDGCCELGDYFQNVKFVINGKLEKSKIIVNQMKYAKIGNSFSIDPKQLKLLAEWPEFSFGKKSFGHVSFNLHNKTNDLGTYCLVNKELCKARIYQANAISSLGLTTLNFDKTVKCFPYFLSNSIDLFNNPRNAIMTEWGREKRQRMSKRFFLNGCTG